MTRQFKNTWRIGRSHDCDYILHDPSVSRCHAEIRQLSNGRYLLVDRNSTQGTEIIGRDGKAHAITQQSVTSDDRVKFGSVTVTVRDILSGSGAVSEKTGHDCNPPKVRCACGAVKSQGEGCHVCGQL